MSQTKVKSGLIDFTEGIDSFIEFSGGNSTVTGDLTVTGTLVGYTPTVSLNISNWDTAYGWGNHASAGYLTSFDITTQTDAKYLRSDADDTMTGNLQIGSFSNKYIRFSTASVWDYYLSAINDDFYIYDSQGLNFFKAIYNSGGTNKYAAILDKLYVYNNGNVGIGTTSPSSPFTVATDVRAATLNATDLRPQSQLNLLGGGGDSLFIGQLTNSTVYIQSSYYNSTLATYPISINPLGGNVGIGTTSPSTKLHVKGIYNVGILQTTASIGGNYLEFRNNSNSAIGYVGYGSSSNNKLFITQLSNDDIVFYNGGNYRAVINTSGDFGIGTTSPSAKLHVNGPNAAFGSSEMRMYINRTDSNVGSIIFTSGTPTVNNGWAEIGQTDSDGDLYFKANPSAASYTTRMIIKGSTGNVGIGTTSPSATLHLQNSQSNAANNTTTGSVFSAVSPNSGVFIRNRGASNGISGSQYTTQLFTDSGSGNFEIYNSSSYYSLVFGTNASERMRITSGGDVGIGKTSVAAKLDIAGAIKNSNRDQTFSRVQKVDGVTGYYSQVKVIFNKTDWGSVTYDIKVASAGGTYHTAGCYYSNPGFSSDLVSISTGSGISLSKTADSPNGGTQGATWTFSGATMIHPIVTVDIACGNGFQATEDSIIITFI